MRYNITKKQLSNEIELFYSLLPINMKIQHKCKLLRKFRGATFAQIISFAKHGHIRDFVLE